jgi:outer membrane biosynthesis protein TonB
MWAVQYDDGMSVSCATEQIAQILAEAERARGRQVTVRHLDDADGEPEPEPEPIPEPEPVQAAEPEPEPIPEPEPAPAVEPVQAAEPASAPEPASEASPPPPEPERARAPGPAFEPEPARASVFARRRRLLIYALAAAGIVVAAVLVGRSGILPSVGANTSSNSTQVGGTNYHPQLLPPLNQPPVVHFSTATGESSGGGPAPIASGG